MTQINYEQLNAIRPLGTSLVADAINTFQVRLQNEGFVSGHVLKCMTPEFGPMLGFAVPARIRTVHPPMRGASFAENYTWWNYVRSLPEPRIIVLQDSDRVPGIGAFIGLTHAEVHKALGCIGVVTNGAVRDLSRIGALGFHCFAGSVSVSRAYAHITEFGIEVEFRRALHQTRRDHLW